jgi:threonine dehydrogenase-like Zn-dependent dehydrogenase
LIQDENFFTSPSIPKYSHFFHPLTKRGSAAKLIIHKGRRRGAPENKKKKKKEEPMKAVVFHGTGDIRLDNVPDPELENPDDAIIHLTASAICGTDLHFVRGTVPDMRPGTILGHEGVGIIEDIGPNVRNLRPGDRVIIPSTIGCGNCSYCRSGYYSQCDVANPNGPRAGTAFFGGPQNSGPFQGLQAEYARVPFANVGLVKLPDEVNDDQAILLSDIFPTGWFGAEMAKVKPGHTVAVFGCGPVGQFAIASAKLMNAGRIFAIDTAIDTANGASPTRLDMAREQGAEVIDFNQDDPVAMLRQLTQGIGVDCAIDCVGIDASCAHQGPAATLSAKLRRQYDLELKHVAPQPHIEGDNWHPGDAPSQVLRWIVDSIAKAGTLSIVGVYPPTLMVFPIGELMNKNLKLNAGNCNHRKYIPHLLELVRTDAIDPTHLISQKELLTDAIEAYREFDRREAGWLKVELMPAQPRHAQPPGKEKTKPTGAPMH